MENYQFPSTYTAISGLLDDVDNSKQWNFELWHYCIKATICLTNRRNAHNLPWILSSKQVRKHIAQSEHPIKVNNNCTNAADSRMQGTADDFNTGMF